VLGLGLANAAEIYVYFLCVVWLVGRGTRWLTDARLHRRIERVNSVVLLAFGVRLATDTR
jgi:threonine/homoserine/homoserine lactone efflux protein